MRIIKRTINFSYAIKLRVINTTRKQIRFHDIKHLVYILKRTLNNLRKKTVEVNIFWYLWLSFLSLILVWQFGVSRLPLSHLLVSLLLSVCSAHQEFIHFCTDGMLQILILRILGTALYFEVLKLYSLDVSFGGINNWPLGYYREPQARWERTETT